MAGGKFSHDQPVGWSPQMVVDVGESPQNDLNSGLGIPETLNNQFLMDVW